MRIVCFDSSMLLIRTPFLSPLENDQGMTLGSFILHVKVELPEYPEYFVRLHASYLDRNWYRLNIINVRC